MLCLYKSMTKKQIGKSAHTIATITHNSYDNKIVIEYRIEGKITIPDLKNSLIGLFLCLKWGKKP